MSRGAGASRHRHMRAVVLLVGVVTALAVPAGAGLSEPRFLTAWGTSGSGDGQFSFPYGVAVAPDGTVYVTDPNNHRIQYFSPAGEFIGTWGSIGTAAGSFNHPRGVAVSADGTVYVSDAFNHRIQYFDPTGALLGAWGTSGDGPGQFAFPWGVAVAADGTVYVADQSNDRIQRFSPTGAHQGAWGSPGTNDGQFDNPRGVAVAADGTVYVADTENHRIQYFTPTGTHQGTWGTNGTVDGQFSFPYGLAVAADGTVFVADQSNHRIQYFTPTGEFIGTWGSIGSDDGEFSSPHAVAAAPFDVVYVADTFSPRIQRFAFPGVTRAAGADRFATAAAISQTHNTFFGVDTVFVATGANFPDALAGAVAAGSSRSPLLLTSSVPEVTAEELDRLDPNSIVILGGTSVVPSATAEQLAAWGTITRLSGANRYETAVEISQHLYPAAGSADTVVIATGTGFADALAGATVAALGNGPVLLTQPGALPAVVRQEILRLDPETIIVLGGTAAVTNAVMAELNGLAPTTRISGPNRYDTAVAISEDAFPTGAEVVYIAVGTNFPDALAGAAQAAASGAPVLLTHSDSLPQAVIDEITRLDPYAIVILGGSAVISPAVEAQLEGLLGL